MSIRTSIALATTAVGIAVAEPSTAPVRAATRDPREGILGVDFPTGAHKEGVTTGVAADDEFLGNWMGRNAYALANATLLDLSLPGTHDTMTCKLSRLFLRRVSVVAARSLQCMPRLRQKARL